MPQDLNNDDLEVTLSLFSAESTRLPPEQSAGYQSGYEMRWIETEPLSQELDHTEPEMIDTSTCPISSSTSTNDMSMLVQASSNKERVRWTPVMRLDFANALVSLNSPSPKCHQRSLHALMQKKNYALSEAQIQSYLQRVRRAVAREAGVASWRLLEPWHFRHYANALQRKLER